MKFLGELLSHVIGRSSDGIIFFRRKINHVLAG
jgi:hypothetical protein